MEWLSGGDLRSDGVATEVADIVLGNPQLIDELYAGLSVPDDVVRGRAADALEKISRSAPELIENHLGEIIDIAMHDDVAMVRWHLAMILGHLALDRSRIDSITSTLLLLLDDKSVFTKSWAIVSLCIVARKFPEKQEAVLEGVAQLKGDESIAIRSKVGNAQKLLLNDKAPFPKGWIKSVHHAYLESNP
ncbi:MAG: hypothetical protein GTO14_15580 [Anaerolineales bacterium]|nr:hypothetical protein [Anaerolineales bacterium]